MLFLLIFHYGGAVLLLPLPWQELEAQLVEIERDVRMLSKASCVRIS